MATTPEYLQIVEGIASKAKRERKKNKTFLTLLKKKKPAGLTKAFREENDKAFSKVNCLDCSNCCRTALAVFEKPDVRRISSHFGMTDKEFIKKYLKPHPDYEYLINTLPCPFLADDNKCGIYEIRPMGCRTYPPAKLQLSNEQLDVIFDNVGICPAVNEIIDNIKVRFQNSAS